MSVFSTASVRMRALAKDPQVTRLAVILALLLIFFAAVRTPSFVRLSTWQSMAVQFPEFGLMALGVMLTMIIGGIDLSVVAIANMTGIGAAVIMLSIAPPGSDPSQAVPAILAAVAFSLVAGALAGMFNGFLVAKIKIPAILVTLGTFELFTGIAVIITQGKPISGLPTQYSEVFAAKLGGIVPMQLVMFALVVVVIWFLMSRTALGTKLYLLGTNPTAAEFSGLNTVSLTVRTYMLSGIFSAVAGLVMLANYNSAKADYGSTYTLLAVLIVVLGGVNPNGGSGRLAGTVLAVIVLQVLSSLLNTFPDISNFYRPLIYGGVLLLVIVMNQWYKPGNFARFFTRKG